MESSMEKPGTSKKCEEMSCENSPEKRGELKIIMNEILTREKELEAGVR